jgi:threonine/homoserine/homoserine lactone efflux protein
MSPTYTPEQFSALALFGVVTLVTPGPNNAMLMASGLNFGLRSTVPHLCGVVLGSAALIFACGLGLGGMFAAFPVLHTVLQLGGGAYLLYLAYRIGTAEGVHGRSAGAEPFGFWQAAAFQFANPKGWAVALGVVSTYVPAKAYLANLGLAELLLACIGVVSTTIWAGFGVGLRRFLDRPVVLRAFNITMALLLVASLYPLFAELGGKR